MSLRIQMLQVARLAPRLLGDSTDLVRNFFRQQLTPEGAGRDRAGRPDLYYTIFTLAGMQALEIEVPTERIEAYLRSFGDGDGLDFVHLSALARCWAVVGVKRMPRGLDRALLARIEAFRKPDGGYEGDAKLAYGTAYGAFVALGAYEDLDRAPVHPLKLIQSLKSLETPDGAWSNIPGARVGATNATAGAVTLIRHLGFPVNQGVGDWLLARAHPQGGFLAAPDAPIPDLLSTATTLHALAAMDHRLPVNVHERCLDFLDTLWSNEGGFHGHWSDDHLDCEYTFYALLALGHLSLGA
ncbi:MAG TPA: prenyltransferase/squalene oxidase repeat-containing protein [Candidatus Angelobacter sp.]|nr:prenyltransferase/squalene oxidase repeat-containing protein [Candidatus Angelobacter sp.]